MNPAEMNPDDANPRSRRFAAALLAAFILAGVPAFAADPLSAANADLQAGKADEAARLLNEALKFDPNNAQANALLCHVEFAVEQFNEAADHCQKAVSASPNNSEYHHWLGRAIGEKASRASFVSAYSLAKKTREEFETAVKLDPRNIDALADLGEFYKEAPGAVGGGTDKAESIAQKLDSLDPAKAHILRAEIAMKQKDPAGAEKEYKAATGSSHPAQAWVELASFYRHQERWADMTAAVNSAAAAAAKDPRSASALANAAGVLVRANREPDLAIKLLTAYIASPNKTEETPVFEALTRLAKLRKKIGDSVGAQRDQASALALAHDYKPAQDLSK